VSWQIDLLVILLELASSDDNSQAWFTLANETARRLDDNQKLSDDLKTWLRVVEDNLVPH
jgi:hypothetical protein